MMDTVGILETLFNVATLEIIFVIAVFKLILGNYRPPIQESLQAIICVIISVTLAMLIETSVHGFMVGVISGGLGFYGAAYINTIKGIKPDESEEE